MQQTLKPRAHLFIVLALLGFALRVSAQGNAIAIPAWMQPYFAADATTTLPATTERAVKHNTFIGSYRARLSVTDTVDGITQHLYLSAWQDSTRGVMQLEIFPGMPHTTWFADIGANMGVVANAIGRKAVVSDLQRVLLVDRLREPGKIREFAPPRIEATSHTDTIAGILCTQYDLIEGRDTMDTWTAAISPSPFADGPAWIPLNEGPLKTFRFLWRFGDLVVFRFQLAPLLTLELLEYQPGSSAPPRIDLSNYEVIPVTALSSPNVRP
jgi:hypothetical protein